MTYKELAAKQHKLLLLIMTGCDSLKWQREMKKYAREVLNDPIFLKLKP